MEEQGQGQGEIFPMIPGKILMVKLKANNTAIKSRGPDQSRLRLKAQGGPHEEGEVQRGEAGSRKGRHALAAEPPLEVALRSIYKFYIMCYRYTDTHTHTQ